MLIVQEYAKTTVGNPRYKKYIFRWHYMSYCSYIINLWNAFYWIKNDSLVPLRVVCFSCCGRVINFLIRYVCMWLYDIFIYGLISECCVICLFAARTIFIWDASYVMYVVCFGLPRGGDAWSVTYMAYFSCDFGFGEVFDLLLWVGVFFGDDNGCDDAGLRPVRLLLLILCYSIYMMYIYVIRLWPVRKQTKVKPKLQTKVLHHFLLTTIYLNQ